MSISKSSINKIADLIISEFNIDHPLDTNTLDSLINALGGNLKQDDELGLASSGKIEKNEDKGFSIIIPSSEPETRKKFSIAHELGHLFLHMDYLNPEKWEEVKEGTVYNRLGSTQEEFEANEFAAALLMPRKLYQEKLDEAYVGDGRYDIAVVADFFCVSLDAAKNRGRWLNLLEW